MRIVPRSGVAGARGRRSATARATAVAVFTGRRRIGGVEHGRGVLLEGVAHHERGRARHPQPGLHAAALSRLSASTGGWSAARSGSPRTSSSDSVGHEHDHLVADPDRACRRGARPPGRCADDGHDGRVAGQAQLGDLLVGGRRARRPASPRPAWPCPPRTTAAARTSRRSPPPRTRAVMQVRRRHRDVDAPHLVEHPLVLRVVDPGDDPRHAELLLGQQRDDEVVLVVAGDGGDDVGLVDARPRPAASTSQASAWNHGTPGGLVGPPRPGGPRPGRCR